jgi:hypothetical protein
MAEHKPHLSKAPLPPIAPPWQPSFNIWAFVGIQDPNYSTMYPFTNARTNKMRYIYNGILLIMKKEGNSEKMLQHG